MAAKMTFFDADNLRAIARARIGYGATQGMLAAQLGVSQAFLSEFLSGKKRPGPEIIRALGFDPEPHYCKLPKEKT